MCSLIFQGDLFKRKNSSQQGCSMVVTILKPCVKCTSVSLKMDHFVFGRLLDTKPMQYMGC